MVGLPVVGDYLRGDGRLIRRDVRYFITKTINEKKKKCINKLKNKTKKIMNN